MKVTRNIDTGDEKQTIRTISTKPKEHFEGRWKSGRLYPLYSVVVNNGTTFISQNAKMKEEPYVIYDADKKEFKAPDGWLIKEMSADSRVTALGGGGEGGVTPEEVEEMIKDKVDKVDGKGLSTNDYDNTEKNKVASAYQKPNNGIPKSDLAKAVQDVLNDAYGAYKKPVTGIPFADLADGVQDSLSNADEAKAGLAGKQDTISDLSAIRSGAAAGATSVQPAEFNVLKDEVDTIGNGAYEEAWDGDSTPVVADIPAGVVVTYNSASYTGTLAASASTVDKIYLVSDGNGNYDRYTTVEANGAYSWKKVGSTAIPLSNYATKTQVSQLQQDLTDLDEQVNGKAAVNLTGTIPVVYNQVNQRVSGAKCTISIPAGTYLFQIDDTYLGTNAIIYAYINGTSVNLGYLYQINGKNVTLSDDATEINIYANAANSLKTGDCPFLFSQAKVDGIVDDIFGLQNSVKRIDGETKSVDVTFALTTAAQYDSGTKKDVDIKAGKYWIDASPMSLLTASSVYVYVYYKSAPSTKVFIGYLSTYKENYWQKNLQEIEFSEDVVAMAIYHTANTTGEGTITISFVDENAVPTYDDRFARLVSKNCPAFTSFKNEETLSPGGVLSLPDVKIIKNSGLFAEISGAVNEVSIGVGYDSAKATNRGYNAYWVVLKPNTLELWWNNNADALIDTYNHGLTLDELTKVSILRKGASCSIRIVTKLGAIYENDSFDWKGVGAPFVENNNASGNIDVSLNFVPRDLSKKIWVFGDSYCGLFNASRWPTQLGLSGIDNYLMNAQGSEAMKAGVNELANVLTLGYIPTYIVWALGMNGTGDPANRTSASDVADYQKLWLMRFLRICKQNDITPILCTIPSVPALNHHALSAYVRSLGYRYIDFAESVGSQVDGTWYAGLLSSDNAHPSTEGARVLAMRVLRDFPEIQLLES